MQNRSARFFGPMLGYSLFYASTGVLLISVLLVSLDLLFHFDAYNYSVILPFSSILLFAYAVFILLAMIAKKRQLVAVFTLLFWGSLFSQWLLLGAERQAEIPVLQLFAWGLLLFGWLGWLAKPSIWGRYLALTSNTLLLLLTLVIIWQDTGNLFGYAFGISPSVAINTAILLLFCATAGLSARYIGNFRLGEYRGNFGSWLALMLATAAILLWLSFMHQVAQVKKEVIATTLSAIQQQLNQIFNEQQGLMYRLADRLAHSENRYNRTLLELELQSYLRDFAYLDYLSVINSSGEIMYSVSGTEKVRQWFDHYLLVANPLPVVGRESNNRPEVSFYYDGKVDHAFIRAALPHPNASEIVLVVASLNFRDVITKLLPVIVAPGYAVKVSYQDMTAPLVDQRRSGLEYFMLGDYPINLFGDLQWRLRLYRDLESELDFVRQIAEVVLLAGWLAVVLALLSQQFQRQLQRQQRRLEISNRRIQHSLGVQRKLQLQHQQIMEHSGDILCMVDGQGRFLEVSRSAEWVLGYAPAELTGRAFMDFVHPEDRLITEREAENILDGQHTQYFRNRYLRKDGKIVYLMWSSRYVKSVGIMYAVARDVTEQVKAEQLQQAQQQVLRMISSEQPLAEIIRQICLLAELQNSALLTSMMLKVGEHLELLAAPSFSEAYREFFATLAIADNAGSCGTAAFQKSLVLVDNIATDPKWQHGAAIVLAEQVQACWSIPMVSLQDEVLGTFAIYCTEARVPTHRELELLISCSRFAAMAIERSQQKRQLTESEQRFRSLYQYNPDPVYVLTENGYFQQINAAGCRLLEWTQAELKQMHFGRVILPEQLPQVSHYFQRALAGESVSFEASILNRSGLQLELQITIVPTHIDGQIAGVIGMAKDVTQRLQTEKQLRLFKRAVDASSSGVIIADITWPDMPITYVNAAFERLTGYTSEEAIGRNCRFLQGTERDSLAIQQIRNAISGRQECGVVLKNYRKDGSIFWNNLFLAPVPDEQGVITHYIGIQTDITAQKNYEQELAYNASYDLLTGLPNRTLLKDRLTQSCKISARHQEKVAVLFIDLDGFKLINDSKGHAVGDEVLRQISNRIQNELRAGDTLARLGGDEFVLMVPDLREKAVLGVLAQHLLTVIAQPIFVEEHELQVTASIGISLTDNVFDEPMQLVQQADLAMYQAKLQGRNNYQWYQAEMETSLNKRLNLRTMLKKAVANQEFVLYYQPQVEAGSGRLIGLEALLRWPHPEHGMIGPDEFIPVAEETGLIVDIGQWVIAQAAAFNASLQQRGIAHLVMAVNLSSLQFQRPGFVEQLQQTLQQQQLAPRWFELELTESLLLQNIEQVVTKLQQLKKLAVSIAIDDFGTGYSSLSYLKRLPINKLKIDRSFIRELVTDQRDAAISRAIIAMAHQLGVRVVAEGVETEAQASFLAKSLCDELQGYYFARPMPGPQLEQFLIRYAPVSHNTAATQQTLLLVDDEENILHSLKRLLRKEPYLVLSCSSAAEALELLAIHQVQVIISDQRMPEMNGTEFLSRVKEMYPDTVRIVLSGYTDLRSVTEAINRGAIYKFMTKPWQDDELKTEIAAAFRRYREQHLQSAGE
ncbi:EAL domain-containing protein [Alishewanella sp. BS5-314]|uniref:EAL domain-containing protein n=1 Tax=Alishewanella sp. BS5-314 TaxID=2755587 RepID=UPI0021BA4BB2|nr:EAL domain-containing protein [Alishewanella sp. BS5-314]MCT8124972.1 EAL domain-containing protein [Alishewanella sp. BS5-314]